MENGFQIDARLLGRQINMRPLYRCYGPNAMRFGWMDSLELPQTGRETA